MDVALLEAIKQQAREQGFATLDPEFVRPRYDETTGERIETGLARALRAAGYTIDCDDRAAFVLREEPES